MQGPEIGKGPTHQPTTLIMCQYNRARHAYMCNGGPPLALASTNSDEYPLHKI